MDCKYDKRHKRLYTPTAAEAATIKQVVDVVRANPDCFTDYTVEICETIYDLMRYGHGWTHSQAVYMGSIIRRAGLGELEIPLSDPGNVMTELFEGINPLPGSGAGSVLQFGAG